MMLERRLKLASGGGVGAKIADIREDIRGRRRAYKTQNSQRFVDLLLAPITLTWSQVGNHSLFFLCDEKFSYRFLQYKLGSNEGTRPLRSPGR